jgi:hypothetical protein
VTGQFLPNPTKLLESRKNKPALHPFRRSRREAGEIVKRDGRASIAAAGFSRKWQNALRVKIYPPQASASDRPVHLAHRQRDARLPASQCGGFAYFTSCATNRSFL